MFVRCCYLFFIPPLFALNVLLVDRQRNFPIVRFIPQTFQTFESLLRQSGSPGSRETASWSNRSTFLENCSLRVSRVNLITRNTAVKLFAATDAFGARRIRLPLSARLSEAAAIRLSLRQDSLYVLNRHIPRASCFIYVASATGRECHTMKCLPISGH